MPRGNFGSKLPDNEKAGSADQGFHIAAEYAGFIDNYFGLGVTFGLRRNPTQIHSLTAFF